MTVTSKIERPRLRFHPAAYKFVFQALQHAQQKLGRPASSGPDDEQAHVSGRELLEGIRELALEQFGLLTCTVFRHWGITGTEDFGRIVFEMVERGDMKKTDRDRLSDFIGVYDFDEVFDRGYRIDIRRPFRR
ncbi:MAG: hypothetical protein KY476_21535 [Planctomycetes bacterium]|nr:hypothetical protein [Planctomycetota bacterium]